MTEPIKKLIVRFDTELNLLNILNKLEINPNAAQLINTIHLPSKVIKYTKQANKPIQSDTKSESWLQHWEDMPEYYVEPLECYSKIIFYIDNPDYEYLSNLFEQTIREKTKSIRCPKLSMVGIVTIKLLVVTTLYILFIL